MFMLNHNVNRRLGDAVGNKNSLITDTLIPEAFSFQVAYLPLNEETKMTNLSKQEKNTAITQFIHQLDGIHSQQKQWESLYKRSNQGLYQILADCLDFYNTIKTSVVEKETMQTLRNSLKSASIKIQLNTPTLTIIVRYVFKSDRRRSHAYARVLNVALKKDIKPDDLVQWIENNDGIEEITKTIAASEATKKKKQELESKVQYVKDYLNPYITEPLAVFPDTPLVHDSDTGEFILLLGKKDIAGKGTKVLTPIPDSSGSMTDTAFKKIATALINDPSKQIYTEEQEGFKFYNLPIDALDVTLDSANDDTHVIEKERSMAISQSLFSGMDFDTEQPKKRKSHKSGV